MTVGITFKAAGPITRGTVDPDAFPRPKTRRPSSFGRSRRPTVCDTWDDAMVLANGWADQLHRRYRVTALVHGERRHWLVQSTGEWVKGWTRDR